MPYAGNVWDRAHTGVEPAFAEATADATHPTLSLTRRG